MPSRSGLTGAQLSYLGVVAGATSAHGGTRDVWEAIKREADRRGEALPADMFSAVNTLRAQASALRNGRESLARASATDAILGSHIAPLPYGNNPSATGGPRTFHVRVGYGVGDASGGGERFVTLVYPGNLPATVGELRAEAETLAMVASFDYADAFEGVSSIEIGEL